jgi:hypothetical protein
VFRVDPESGIAGPAVAVRKRNQTHHAPNVEHDTTEYRLESRERQIMDVPAASRTGGGG